jgi:hypothetical protein
MIWCAAMEEQYTGKLMNMPSAERRNTAILFESHLNNEFIRLSNIIAQRVRSRVILNTSYQLPHLSLYNAGYPAANLPKAEDALAALTPTLSPFTMHLNRKSITAGYIFLDAAISDELRNLHERIIEELNPIREGVLDEKEFDLPGVTDDMRTNLRESGMLLSQAYYQPHVTLSRPENLEDCDQALSLLPEQIDFTANVTHIHFVETGQSGICKKVINSYKLGA